MSDEAISPFPILDYDRPGSVILSACGYIDALVQETSTWVTMPVRVAMHGGVELCIELGPYSLDHHDLAVLRRAIRVYDTVVEGCKS